MAYLYPYQKRMKRNTPILLTTLLLTTAACADSGRNEHRPEALHVAERIRESWTDSKRTVEVEIDGRSETELDMLKEVSLTADFVEATPSERDAFAGIACIYAKGRFVPNQAAVTADSTATFYVSYPSYRGKTTADTLTLHAPFGEHLYGMERGRTMEERVIRVRMQLESSMAVLRLHVESDDLRDRLGGFTLMSDNLWAAGRYQPYRGLWQPMRRGGTIRTKDIDCLLNNGRQHDIYLIPTDTASHVALIAHVNGSDHALRTTLPPLQRGTLTQLNLRLDRGKMSVVSSWVETTRTISVPPAAATDSIRAGYYLQADGRVVSEYSDNSIAVVIETDGKHGKAIALRDEEGRHLFAGRDISSGLWFATIDGATAEGRLNPMQESELDTISKVVYKPGMPYGEDTALGYRDGAHLTQRLLDATGISEKATMLTQVQAHKGSYVPTLGELAKVYYLQQPYARYTFPMGYEPLEGGHLSSSESTQKTYYFLDFTTGDTSGSISKRYTAMKLRLFYLF